MDDEIVEMLFGWKKQIDTRRNIHSKSAITYKRWHYGMSIPSIIFGTIASAGILSSSASEALTIVNGVFALSSTALTSINTYLSYNSLSDKHKDASDDYYSLSRSVESVIRLSSEEDNLENIIDTIKKQFDEIMKNAPPIDCDVQLEVPLVALRVKRHGKDPPSLNETSDLEHVKTKKDIDKEVVNQLNHCTDDSRHNKINRALIRSLYEETRRLNIDD